MLQNVAVYCKVLLSTVASSLTSIKRPHKISRGPTKYGCGTKKIQLTPHNMFGSKNMFPHKIKWLRNICSQKLTSDVLTSIKWPHTTCPTKYYVAPQNMVVGQTNFKWPHIICLWGKNMFPHKIWSGPTKYYVSGYMFPETYFLYMFPETNFCPTNILCGATWNLS